MGTRADFYVGVGPDAEWLGSVGFDGYQWDEQPDCPLMQASSEEEYRAAVECIAASRNDWTDPEQGWPWPWNDSKLTDYAYAFVDGKTQVPDRKDWPDMSDRRNVATDQRSGMIFIGLPREPYPDEKQNG